jgi:hypothetical protein
MRKEHLASAETLDRFLQSFEDRTLPKSEFTHGAHLTVAAVYLFDSDAATVLPLMRDRISAFNVAVGGANTSTAGYHETLTRFWLLVVQHHLRSVRPATCLEAARQALAAFGEERALHTRYYSGDVVKDSAARREWRSPDLLPLPDETG